MRSRLALVAAMPLFLGGCASAGGLIAPRPAPPITVYAPAAASADGLGYDALRLGPDRWRVWYTTPPGSGAELAERYALRHADELALDHGYDWFRVQYETAPRHGEDHRPVTPDGALTPHFSDSAGPQGLVGRARGWLPGGPAMQVTAVLDIEAGRGPRPGGARDAAAIVGSYP